MNLEYSDEPVSAVRVTTHELLRSEGIGLL